MSAESSYNTISGVTREEIKVRGSRFIATAYPVRSREDAGATIGQIRKEFWDATHNTYAWRLSPDGAQYRFSDDGEPSGTAGKPILFVIGQRALVNVLVVVTRYFGGTKLGAGGLARAYTRAASAVLDKSAVVTIYDSRRVRLFVPYEDIRAVRPLIEEFALEFHEEFLDVVNYIVDLRQGDVDHFATLLTEASQGRAGLVRVDSNDTL